jgi:Ca2+:H+ antiporter
MTDDDEPEDGEDNSESKSPAEQDLPPWEGFRSAFSIRKHKVNVMLFLVPLAGGMALFSNNQTVAFILSLAAIMPLASLMGRATEEIALRTSQSIGGLLNATFGNSAEIIIALMAIYAASQALALGTTEGDATAATMIKIVQASLIGSILGNLLLVLGLAFVWGGMKHHVQNFSPDAVGANGSLLLLAVIALIVPTTFVETVSGDAAAVGVLYLSRISAFILLGLYGLFLLFQLKTHQELFASSTRSLDNRCHLDG